MSTARHIHDAIIECKRLQSRIGNLMDFERDGRHATLEELHQVYADLMRLYASMAYVDREFHVEQDSTPCPSLPGLSRWDRERLGIFDPGNQRR